MPTREVQLPGDWTKPGPPGESVITAAWLVNLSTYEAARESQANARFRRRSARGSGTPLDVSPESWSRRPEPEGGLAMAKLFAQSRLSAEAWRREGSWHSAARQLLPGKNFVGPELTLD